MDTFLVSYSCRSNAARDDSTLLDAIKHYPCAKLNEASYAISTTESADEVFARLSRYVNEQDALYVIPLQGPWRGQGPHYVNNLFDHWL